MKTDEPKPQPSLPVAKRKTGRPSKFNRTLVRRVLRCLEKGMPLSLAASAGGVIPGTIGVYRRENPDFDEQCKAAISRGVEARLDVVVKAMESADENVRLRAATWLLSHVPGSAEHFSESRRIELSGELDGKIAVLVWPHAAPKEVKKHADDTATAIAQNAD